MTKLTIRIYEFFRTHRALFYAFLLATTALFAYFSAKIEFEEDITQLLPSIKKNGAEKLAFSNLKVKDKVFILFRAKSDTIGPDRLAEATEVFSQGLLKKDSTVHAVQHIFYRVAPETIQNSIAFLYENAPVFMDDSKYAGLDSLLTPEAIDRQMADNFRKLTSPAGMAYRDLIQKDPIGLRNLYLSGSTQIGGNYTLYNHHIFTPDTSVAIAFLSPNFRTLDSKQSTVLVHLLDQEIETFSKENPGIDILYHGAPIQSVSNSQRIKKDLFITVSISLVLIFAILLVCFKNKSTLFYLTAPVVYGILFALTVLYLIKGSMSLIALGIGAIIMGVAFSYCLHLICHYKYVTQPKKLLEDLTVPLIMGALTTIGAFAGMLLTGSELLHDFGLFASLGLLGTTIFALLFLPQFFRPEKNRRSEKAFALLDRINSYPFEKNKILLFAIVAISIFCYFKSGDVQFDSNLRHIGYNNDRLVRSQELLASKTTENQTTFYFASVASDLDSALILNQQLGDKLEALKKEGIINGYSSPGSFFIPKAEQERRIGQWEHFWTDERKSEVKQLLIQSGRKYRFSEATFDAFFALLDKSYQPVSLYDSQLLPEEILSNVVEQTDGKYLLFTPIQMDKERLWEAGDQVTEGNDHYIVVDPMYYASNMVKQIHDDFDTTLAVSSLFVLFVMLVSYRGIVLTALAFMPMGLSWYIVLGFMSVFGLEFNLINIIISSFIFGIGDDYSIFIMDGLLEKYRTRKPLLVYYKTAILFSAIVLIIAIVSLLFAVHPAIHSIGLVTLVGMGSTILIAYSLQPFLFSLLIANRAEKGKAPFSISGLFWWKKGAVRDIKSNYLYKGNDIEDALRAELRQTQQYALLTDAINGKKRLLDFGSGNGFTSYWAALQNKELQITGYETDDRKIAIARHCYLKSDRIDFTDTASRLKDNYDFLILNDQPDETQLPFLIRSAELIAVRKGLTIKLPGFKEDRADARYLTYRRIG